MGMCSFFLVVFLGCVSLFLVVVVGHGVEAFGSRNLQSQEPDTMEQPYRTAYHFQPAKNWMNDPNGPMYYRGIYHLFYQYNPDAPVFGKIDWGHSVSYDLINWVLLDPALRRSEPFDINGCWSGSITILPGEKPVILYTGISYENKQVQNSAVPKNLSDPLLREWVKSENNPLMTPVDGIVPDLFRDPTTAWYGPDMTWRVIIGGEIDGNGTAVLYHSKDFMNWTKSERPLHYSDKTGMWECPDFYPVSINGKDGVDTSGFGQNTKHVLKASFNSHDYYIIGHYEVKTDRYLVRTNFLENDTQLRYDYGKLYASKSFFDSSTKRRILWGWINESDSEHDDIKKGWAGIQSIPRTILLAESRKQLVQWPVRELEDLREQETITIHDTELKGGSLYEVVGTTASQADVEVSFDIPNLKEAESIDTSLVDPQLLCSKKPASLRGKIGPFGLLVLASNDLSEQTAIFFRVFKNCDKYAVLMCSDQSRSSFRENIDKTTYGAFVDIELLNEKLSLRTLIDHSVVESFAGGGVTCITARVYPLLAVGQEAHLYVFNNGTASVRISKLSAWNMKQAHILHMQK